MKANRSWVSSRVQHAMFCPLYPGDVQHFVLGPGRGGGESVARQSWSTNVRSKSRAKFDELGPFVVEVGQESDGPKRGRDGADDRLGKPGAGRFSRGRPRLNRQALRRYRHMRSRIVGVAPSGGCSPGA